MDWMDSHPVFFCIKQDCMDSKILVGQLYPSSFKPLAEGSNPSALTKPPEKQEVFFQGTMN